MMDEVKDSSAPLSEYSMGEKSTFLPMDTGRPKTSKVQNQEPPVS